MLRPGNIHYELAERTRGMAYGGIGLDAVAGPPTGLGRSDRRAVASVEDSSAVSRERPRAEPGLQRLVRRRLAWKTSNCGATTKCISTPSARGAFPTRRRPATSAAAFSDASRSHAARRVQRSALKVWAEQPAEFFDEARIDMDGTLVPTGGECKEGMDITYNGQWGYHPLVVSLANTGEVLRIVNRSGNRPSHEGAAEEVDRVLEFCRRRLSTRAVAWRHRLHADQAPRPLDRRPTRAVHLRHGLHGGAWLLADDLPAKPGNRCMRPPRYAVKTKPRHGRRTSSSRSSQRREFKNIRLVREEVAEFDTGRRPASKTYRMVVVKKYLEVSKDQAVLFDDYRYFFYLTNDRELLGERSRVRGQRPLRSGEPARPTQGRRAGLARAGRQPGEQLGLHGDDFAGLEPEGRWACACPSRRATVREQAAASEKRRVLRMEFKTFLNALMRLPCQIVRTGRRLIYRLLSWNPWQACSSGGSID